MNLTAQELLSALPPDDARRKLFTKFSDTSEVPPKKRKSKYNAVPVIYDGIRFASTKEGNAYLDIKSMVNAGEVLWFLRQVPFRFACGATYWADFLLVTRYGVRVIDVKGVKTAMFKRNLKMMKQEYPQVTVELWR